MGIGSSSSKEKRVKEKKSENPHGMFNAELNHVFDPRHKYQDPYVPLFLIQAHSIEPDSTMFDLPKGIDILHYCKKGCILRTKRLKKNKNAEVKSRNHSELNTDLRSISMEYACLKRLEIYDRYEHQCPHYQFSIEEAIKNEGGIYQCLDKEIRKIFTFEPGQNYRLQDVITFIQHTVSSKKIHIGILACRRIQGCTDVVVALPGSPSQHANMLDPEHKPHRRTINRNMEEAIKGLPKSLAIRYRKTKKSRSP